MYDGRRQNTQSATVSLTSERGRALSAATKHRTNCYLLGFRLFFSFDMAVGLAESFVSTAKSSPVRPALLCAHITQGLDGKDI